MGKRVLEGCKAAAIVLLLCSAALLSLTIAYDSGWLGAPELARLAARLGGTDSQPPRMAQEPALTDAAQPLLISVLGQAERASFWGDFAALDSAYEALGSQLAAALDTAAEPAGIPASDFFAAAAGQGVYFRFPGPIPLSVLGAWLDAGGAPEIAASRFFLALEEDRVALLAGDGTRWWRMETQVDAALLADVLDDYPADGTRLALEVEDGGCRRLNPLTLVDAGRTSLRAGGSGNPCDETFQIATAAALGFNPYGDSKYRDDDGSIVYTESDCTLRITTDGLLTLTNGGLAPRFSAASAGDGDRIEYVRALLQALAGGSLGDGRLLFSGLEADTVCFSYYLDGLPVEQSQGPAVQARFKGAVLSALRFRVRTYTLSQTEEVPLLPAAQAAALRPWGAELQPAYADVGESRLQAGWLQ